MTGVLITAIVVAIFLIREYLVVTKLNAKAEVKRRAERDRHIAEMEEELGLPSLRGGIDWGLNYIMETYGKDKWKCPDIR